MKYKIKTHSQLAVMTDTKSGEDINLSQMEDRLNHYVVAIGVIKKSINQRKTKAEQKDFIELAISRMEEAMVVKEVVKEVGFTTDYDSVETVRPAFWDVGFPTVVLSEEVAA